MMFSFNFVLFYVPEFFFSCMYVYAVPSEAKDSFGSPGTGATMGLLGLKLPSSGRVTKCSYPLSPLSTSLPFYFFEECAQGILNILIC